MPFNYNSGHDPNTSNPPTRAYIVLGAVLPFYALSLLMVGSRILVKRKLGKLGVDDLLIAISTTLAMGVMICTIIACKYGFGLHVADFRPEWQLPYGKVFYAAVVICSPCVYVTKTSMLCFYLQLAPHQTFRRLCFASIGVTTVCWTGIFLVNTFGCTPISGAWNRSPQAPSKCITTPGFYRFSVLSNLATDVLVMLLPLPILTRMHMAVKTKIGLMVMFSMGFLTTAVSAMCLHTVNIAISSTDLIWDGAYTWLWSLLELNFGIMTACMPAMMMVWKWGKGEYCESIVPRVGGGRMGQGSTWGGAGSRKRVTTDAIGSASSEMIVGEVYAMGDLAEGEGSKLESGV